MTANKTHESAIDSRLRRMPSWLETRTVSGLNAMVMSSSRSHEPIPTSENARATVAMTADKSKIALTAEIPAMSAVLFQLVCSIAGAQSFLRRQFVSDERAWYGANIVGHVPEYRGKRPNFQWK